MPDSLIILLCCITVSISVWLVNVLRAFYKDFHVVTALPPNPYVSGRPKLSRLLVLYWKFTEGLRPFTWFFYGYGQNKRRKILRTIVVVVGILPASIVGIFLLLIDTDKSTALLLLALGAILILLLRMLYLYSRNGMLDGGGGSDKYPEGFYIGNAKLPRKIYVGDSRNLFINLRPSVYPLSQQVSISTVIQKSDQVELNLKVPWDDNNAGYLEVELIGAGFEVRGETRQRQALNSRTLSFVWNCYYPNSGDQSYAIRFRKTTDTTALDIGYLEGTIRVAKLFNLTQNQVYAIAAVFGIPSGLYLFISAMKSLIEALNTLH